MGALKPFLDRAANGEPFSPADMKAAMEVLLSGNANDAEIGGFMMALRTKGLTVDEIAAAAEALRSRALKVEAPVGAIDTCGTGGDGADTFNISTAAALIVAGAGVPVAKHGNKAASSKSGSAEVLEALGVKLDIPPAQISRCIHEAGVGFMFANLHHEAAKHVAPARRALGVKTLFNLLGPLANPAGAKRQLMGVYDKSLLRPVAEVMARLGVESAWVVHGSDGLDELTTTGPSFVAALKGGEVSEFEITPEDAGIARAKTTDLKGGDPQANAAAIRRLLEGEKGPFRDIAVLNAGAALLVAGMAKDLVGGARLAEETIDEGKASAALESLVLISNEAK
jgi:anthranilate phosphoribosyltransferase